MKSRDFNWQQNFTTLNESLELHDPYDSKDVESIAV